MKKLYRLFVAFAIFNLLTISFALVLDYHVTGDYSASLAASQRWMSRIASYNAMDQLAGSVEGAPNNAFDDGQLDTGARQMEASISRFVEALNNARRETTTESPAHVPLQQTQPRPDPIPFRMLINLVCQ